MFGQNFYFSTIRKYVTLFGTLFNDISIIRTDKNGHMTQLIKVPITYGPKEKMLARLQQDPDIDRPTATVTLPVMSFEMTGINYEPSRKLHTVGRIAHVADSANSLKYQYNPVPYNFDFQLNILVKNTEDGTKIIEQILPFFTPDFTVTVQLIPEMGVTMEIPIVLHRVSHNDSYNGSFTERQSLTWTLDFTVKGYIYGPVKTTKVIKYTNTAFYTPHVPDGKLQTAIGNVGAVSYVQIQPGLTIDGQPTSNASLSIAVKDIVASDDFGYVTFKTDTDAIE